MLRLLVITDAVRESQGTGSIVFCDDLIRELQSRHELRIIAGSSRNGVESDGEILRIDRAVAPDPEELQKILNAHIRLNDYDIIYNLGGLQFGCAVVNALREKDRQLPLVNHFQAILGSYANIEGLNHEFQEFNSAIQQDVARGAVLNIFSSDAELRHATLAGFDFSNSEVSVIPNGVNLATIKRAEAQAESGSSKGEPRRHTIFATAGRFSDYVKGGDLVYRAFKYLYELRQDVFLLSLTDSLRFADILQELPPDSYRIVTWLPREQFLAQLAQADVVIVPSRYEAFGLVALEGMLLGKPVIATATGGLQSLVRHGETGLLSAPGEGSFGLFQAMRTLCDNSMARTMMGQAGHRVAMEEYRISRVAHMVESNLARALLHHRSFSRAGLGF